MITEQRSKYLSDSVESIQPSGIRRFFDLASSMENVISLGVGEPDFVTPWNVIEASYHSLEQGYTAYTANAGLLELRKEITRYMRRRFGVTYNAENEMVVTVGASQAIDIALRAVVNPGEEVIVVEPSFVSYAPTVTLAGGVPVPVHTYSKNDFKLQPEHIEEAVTEKTKAILLCSPNNPTGTVLSKTDLQKIAQVVEKHDLLVISDEIYAELTYDEPYTSFPSVGNMRERTILISGFSKAFAMTGWRLGFACGPKDILQAMLKIHQYTMMCAPTMAQHAALEALVNGQKDVIRMKESYRQRRSLVTHALEEMGLSCHIPGGAFYVFPSIKSTGLSSEEFAEQLLLKEQVAVVPGSVFGESGEGHIRCSYATSIAKLEEAMKRIKRFIENRE
ncbi:MULTISPECIES: aminotransferase [Fictibacillus]|uniref:Aminotransferase n=1 Tax=Fictibacillus enclensis TaxID=1017270 RepID=A0A0V8JCC6_9BACL|nr:MULTISPECIES: aminotransferase [Fictibacillus]KSU84617.1 aromatic amino acid aminotransferase [Fictibacillus enclensis]RXY99736.1 aminotransferase [Fictibacillus sp. S7]SCB82486.1 aminotransferase [Fictibacillus enclensis]